MSSTIVEKEPLKRRGRPKKVAEEEAAVEGTPSAPQKPQTPKKKPTGKKTQKKAEDDEKEKDEIIPSEDEGELSPKGKRQKTTAITTTPEFTKLLHNVLFQSVGLESKDGKFDNAKALVSWTELKDDEIFQEICNFDGWSIDEAKPNAVVVCKLLQFVDGVYKNKKIGKAYKTSAISELTEALKLLTDVGDNLKIMEHDFFVDAIADLISLICLFMSKNKKTTHLDYQKLFQSNIRSDDCPKKSAILYKRLALICDHSDDIAKAFPDDSFFKSFVVLIRSIIVLLFGLEIDDSSDPVQFFTKPTQKPKFQKKAVQKRTVKVNNQADESIQILQNYLQQPQQIYYPPEIPEYGDGNGAIGASGEISQSPSGKIRTPRSIPQRTFTFDGDTDDLSDIEEDRNLFEDYDEIIANTLTSEQSQTPEDKKKNIAWEPDQVRKLEKAIKQLGPAWSKIQEKYTIQLGFRKQVQIKDKVRTEIKRRLRCREPLGYFARGLNENQRIEYFQQKQNEGTPVSEV